MSIDQRKNGPSGPRFHFHTLSLTLALRAHTKNFSIILYEVSIAVMERPESESYMKPYEALMERGRNVFLNSKTNSLQELKSSLRKNLSSPNDIKYILLKVDPLENCF